MELNLLSTLQPIEVNESIQPISKTVKTIHNYVEVNMDKFLKNILK